MMDVYDSLELKIEAEAMHQIGEVRITADGGALVGHLPDCVGCLLGDVESDVSVGFRIYEN